MACHWAQGMLAALEQQRFGLSVALQLCVQGSSPESLSLERNNCSENISCFIPRSWVCHYSIRLFGTRWAWPENSLEK